MECSRTTYWCWLHNSANVQNIINDKFHIMVFYHKKRNAGRDHFKMYEAEQPRADDAKSLKTFDLIIFAQIPLHAHLLDLPPFQNCNSVISYTSPGQLAVFHKPGCQDTSHSLWPSLGPYSHKSSHSLIGEKMPPLASLVGTGSVSRHLVPGKSCREH